MLGNSIPMVPPAQCSALAGFEHSPVNIIPEPCRTGMGLTWGRRVSFCQPPQAASSPCPAAGDGTSTCAPPGVSALGVQRRGEGSGTRREVAQWRCSSVLSQLEELARAGCVCEAGVLAASPWLHSCITLAAQLHLTRAPGCQGSACPCAVLPPQHHPALQGLCSAGLLIHSSRGGENCHAVKLPKLQRILLPCCSLAPCSGQ